MMNQLCRTYNGCQWIQKSLLHPRKGELLVKIAAFGINRLDLDQAKTASSEKPHFLGLELSGRVVKVGSGVKGFKLGDSVMSLVEQGAYADYALVSAATTLKVPRSINLRDAAALPEALFTAWLNIFKLGRALPTDQILIHGGSGGMGIHAIQICRALGHKVYATTGSDEKFGFLKRAGAHRVFNYSDLKWVDKLLKAAPKGVDIIYDLLGTSHLDANFKVLSQGGRLVLIDSLSGDVGPIDLGNLFLKQLSITASLLRPLPLSEKAKIASEIKRKILPLISSKHIIPKIGAVYRIEDDIATIHRAILNRSHLGKVIVEV